MTADALVLRPATNADAPAVRALVFAVLREYGLKPDPQGTDADLVDVDVSYTQRGGCFDVLVDASGGGGGGGGGGGAVVGTVALFPCEEGCCELRKMYLHPSVRGRGWGRRLLDHALAEARARGYKRMVLETATVLREAVALYERYGFRPYQAAHCAARCDRTYYLDLPPHQSDGSHQA